MCAVESKRGATVIVAVVGGQLIGVQFGSKLVRDVCFTERGAGSYGTYRSCQVTISNLWDLWRSRIPREMRHSRGTSYLFELITLILLMGFAHKYNNSHKFE